jgi:UDP-N-acetylglucosamine--N-acetylmuramyl-(pentapeptide) pyrophosphoryl-undecaprenol N-acetylglucosamine transferase
MPDQTPKIIISGGGTGGHIFPAIAIADAIKRKVPNACFLFVGATGKMEMEKVPAAGYQIKGIPVRGLQRRLSLANLSFPFRLMASMWLARRIIKEFKPDVAVGVGGYASGPLLRMALSAGIPTLIQEQNSYPGITNKLLASRVDKICVAYRDMEKYFPSGKIILTGNPIRADILNIDNKKAEAAAYFRLDKNQPCILVTGGSLGARTINESVMKSLDKFTDKGLQVIWQCGKTFYPEAKPLKSVYEAKKIRIEEFITRMDLAYAMADVVISRAGAIALAEIAVAGKPAVLVPSPHVAEDHQTHNALTLVNTNAALMVKDSEARQKLADVVIGLVEDEILRKSLVRNLETLAHTDAADRIADEVLELIKK